MDHCCCLSEEFRVGYRLNKQIERQLARDKLESRRVMKVLVLGTGQSGKSTFVKQMRLIHGEGFTKKDQKYYAPLICQDVYKMIQALINAMETLDIPYANPSEELKRKIASLNAVNSLYVESFKEEHVSYIKEIWEDSGIRSCYERRRHYQLSDATTHYMSNLDRISAADYLPTVDDILRVRVPTTGVSEYSFETETITFRLVDVGGQRSERRKWIHCFESVTAFVFFVAMSEYDQMLIECGSENRLVESLSLFEVILTFNLFQHSSLVLFFNKRDLFEEKIQTSHLANYFPEYKGPKQDAKAAGEFIQDMFLEVCRRKNRKFNTHFTCATDTDNMRFVFNAIKEKIFEKNLEDYNLL